VGTDDQPNASRRGAVGGGVERQDWRSPHLGANVVKEGERGDEDDDGDHDGVPS